MPIFRRFVLVRSKIIWAKAKRAGLSSKMNGYTLSIGIVWFLMNITTGRGATRRKISLLITIGRKSNPSNKKLKNTKWSLIRPTTLMKNCYQLLPITTFIYRVRHSVPSIRASLLKSKFSTGRIPMNKRQKIRGRVKITHI